jgi:hypothetical protein
MVGCGAVSTHGAEKIATTSKPLPTPTNPGWRKAMER